MQGGSMFHSERRGGQRFEAAQSKEHGRWRTMEQSLHLMQGLDNQSCSRCSTWTHRCQYTVCASAQRIQD